MKLIFSCVCVSCCSLETLGGWYFLLWDDPVQIRGNGFYGSGLMTQTLSCFALVFVFALKFCSLILFLFAPHFLHFLCARVC